MGQPLFTRLSADFMLIKKILIIMFCVSFYIPAGGEEICVTIPDGWRPIAEDSIISLDQWIYDAIQGKVNKSEERIIKKEIDLSLQKGEAIPATRDAIRDHYLGRPEYKNRKQRDEEERRTR